MGLFFYTKKGSIISTVDLPTTEIIEPKKIVFKPRFHIEIVIFYKNFLRFYEKTVKNVV